MPRGISNRVESGLLAAGLGLMILHNIDEAFIHPETDGKLNLVVVGLVSVLALIFLRRLSPPWRAGIMAGLGLLGFVQGIFGHVVHIFAGTAAPIDYSGVLFAAGGAVLLGLAVVVFNQWRTAAAARRP